jgi:hypothetical protein
MTEEEYKEIYRENVKKINKIMDMHIGNIKKAYPVDWWSVLNEDKFYKFLCGELTKLKMINIYPEEKIELADLDRFLKNN